MREVLTGGSATTDSSFPGNKTKILNTTSVFGSLHKCANCRCGEGQVLKIMYTDGAMSILKVI
jgi:hypothetical protein